MREGGCSDVVRRREGSERMMMASLL